MNTNTSSALDNAMSRIRSAFLWLMITFTFRRKSKPQYVGPKVVAIDKYLRPTMKPMFDQSTYTNAVLPLSTLGRLKRMETELGGPTEDRDTGWVPSPSQPWPWLPKPEPGQKISGSRMYSGAQQSIPPMTADIPCRVVAEIIPGLTMTLSASPDAAR